MSEKKQGAYGTGANDTAFRRTWDKEEYRKKAEVKEEEARQYAAEVEKALKQGKKPPKRRREELPKPTEKMKRREGSLELEKNLNKVMVVSSSSNRGPGAPGFYCEVCRRTHKDSVGYLDHLNSRQHLRRLGQSTRQTKSTLQEVRDKIAELRAKSAESTKAKEYDFQRRMAEIKAEEAERKAERKEKKKRKSEAAVPDPITNQDGDADMSAMMGFGSFGTAAKR